MMLTAEKTETTSYNTHTNKFALSSALTENTAENDASLPVGEGEYLDITPISLLPKSKHSINNSNRPADNAEIIKRIKDNAEFIANLAALGVADNDSIADLSRNIALDAALLA